MVLLTLGRVCVLVGVQKEREKNEVKQQKNEINAVSIQVVWRTDSVTFVSKCESWVGLEVRTQGCTILYGLYHP